MSQHRPSPRRADYGIDAPDVLRRFALLGVIGVSVGCVLFFALGRGISPGLTSAFGSASLCMGGSFLVMAGVMLWGSKVGKRRLADRIIGTVSLQAAESVLDVGCGHGLMLIAAAKNLSTGKAIGVDIWQQVDQAGNSREATLQNVRIEGVEDRVELKDGDARNLPFADNTFDVVLSSWALHNIYDSAGREKAVREIVRVLKPGGRAAIVDIRHTAEYSQVLRRSGMQDVMRSAPYFLFVIPSYLLTATKPLGA